MIHFISKDSDKLLHLLLFTLLLFVTTMSQTNAVTAPDKNSAPWVGETISGKPCEGNSQGYGPFDYRYRDAFKQNLRLVEGAHFSGVVKNLERGKSGTIPGDLDYTLRAWPNHHNALKTIERYEDLRPHSNSRHHKYKLVSPIECYYQRALNFAPDDLTVITLYSIYMHRNGHYEQAKIIYERGLKLDPDNKSLHYNFGLLLVKIKEYKQAVLHAKKAYDAGYPLPGLKNQLQRVGHWPQERSESQ